MVTRDYVGDCALCLVYLSCLQCLLFQASDVVVNQNNVSLSKQLSHLTPFLCKEARVYDLTQILPCRHLSAAELSSSSYFLIAHNVHRSNSNIQGRVV